MAPAARKIKGVLPPCPDPERYVRVDTREGSFWRRKRGTVKTAALNGQLLANRNAMMVLMPVASRLLRYLEPYTRELRKGRITLRTARHWLPGYKKEGRARYRALEGLDLQPDAPLDHLLTAPCTVSEAGTVLRLGIALEKISPKAQNNLVTHYYLEAILLHGDCMAHEAPDVSSTTSALYAYGEKPAGPCVLELPQAPAGEPWMLLLKLCSLEGGELAAHYKHYGMKIVKCGDGDEAMQATNLQQK